MSTVGPRFQAVTAVEAFGATHSGITAGHWQAWADFDSDSKAAQYIMEMMAAGYETRRSTLFPRRILTRFP